MICTCCARERATVAGECSACRIACEVECNPAGRIATLESALATERATRPPDTTWRGPCGHVWVTTDCGQDGCPVCRLEAEVDRLTAWQDECRRFLIVLEGDIQWQMGSPTLAWVKRLLIASLAEAERVTT